MNLLLLASTSQLQQFDSRHQNSSTVNCTVYKDAVFDTNEKGSITYSNAVVLSGIGNGIVLDWEAQECTSLDGGQLLNDKVDGDLQFLPPGDSVISWTGTVAKLVVTPNWRFL